MNRAVRSVAVMFALFFIQLEVEAITIGAGPKIGTDKRGTDWYEEFQDWSSNDVRALDRNADQYAILNDGNDTSRDIIAFYSHDDGGAGNYYFRLDFFDLLYNAENGSLDVYVLIDCASGGATALPDGVAGTTDHPWDIAIKLYDSANADVVNASGTSVKTGNWLGSYWRADLDSVEFGVKRQALINAGWDGSSPITFQVFTTKDFNTTVIDSIPHSYNTSTHVLSGGIPSNSTVNRAKYAAIAHANQSLGTRSQTQAHIYTARPDLNLYPGFVRAIDSAEMLHAPLNMHISGTLLSSFMWARSSDPTVDGPTFLQRIKNFINSGTGSLIGGVYAEHIMPYFEGAVNQASIRAFNDLALSIFNLTTNDMKVMHVPERVIHSNTGWAHANPNGPLKGLPFEDIKAGGYQATYLDEITHLHWWFYSDETNYFVNNCGCAKWAGFGGCEDRPYHHKLHRINGVLTFVINDREDQSKFGNTDGGMLADTRYTLLDKAMSSDPDQITIVFDDWEAYAGNCFTCSQPVNNADQWHNTIRWAANHQWIQIVNLKDVVTWAQSDPGWIYEDHGNVDGKTIQTYEWLKHASQQDYDHWYYGQSGLEEDFSQRHPPVDPNRNITTAKPYGDMNTTGTLLRDAWDKVAAMPAGNLRNLAEWTYSAMIYETAWHDENAPPGFPPAWWTGPGWDNSYKSRNYQVTFDRNDSCTQSMSDYGYNATSGWALRLHGHTRKVGILADAAQWVQAINAAGTSYSSATVAEHRNLDDDPWDVYILRNNRVYLVFKRWGARLIYAFVYDPVAHDATQVIGVPVANPAEETDAEDTDNTRCSGFKDRYASNPSGHSQYVDMDYAATVPTQGSNFWEFVSSDGQIRKRMTLLAGRDAVQAQYTLGNSIGSLYIRHGLGPNQWDLLHHGDTNLVIHTDNSFFYGLTNKVGGAVYAVRGVGNSLNVVTNLDQAGYQNRGFPLIEQVEVYNSGGATNFSTWLAFSPASANDIDGDGLSNALEQSLGTNPENPDTDGNGLTDGFEYQYFGVPTGNDPNADSDGDGFTNLQEQTAGTSPVDPKSAFRITSITPDQPGTLRITWNSVLGVRYQIYFRDSTTNAWQLVAPDSVLAAGTTTSYVTGSSGNVQRYYRVGVVPNP